MGNVLGPIDVILRFTLHVPLLDLRGTSLGLVNVVRVELLVSLPFFKGATIVLCLFVLREVLPQLSDNPGEVATIALGALGNHLLVDNVFAEDKVAIEWSGIRFFLQGESLAEVDSSEWEKEDGDGVSMNSGVGGSVSGYGDVTTLNTYC